MKTLYIDCTNGVCADMFISGFRALGVEAEFMPFDEFEVFLHEMQHHLEDSQGLGRGEGGHEHGHSHGGHEHGHGEDGHEHSHGGHGEDGHGHSHGADGHHHSSMSSYQFIKGVIRHLPLPLKVRDIAEKIYKTIALAEAEVHGATLETVHFHEVGRPQAIYNAITVAMQVAEIGADRIVCSDVYDGHGTIECSHGVIPVPVPAVRAMMKNCNFNFVTADVETEMVTPSGLGMLIGIGAKPDCKSEGGCSGKFECVGRPAGSIIAKGTGYGGRDTGRGGMEIYLIDEEN